MAWRRLRSVVFNPAVGGVR